jgi:hypothetical protein
MEILLMMDHRNSRQPHPTSAAWKRAEAYGIDISLLKANLRLTVAERLIRHDAALRSMLSLREAVQREHAKHG